MLVCVEGMGGVFDGVGRAATPGGKGELPAWLPGLANMLLSELRPTV